MCTITENGVLLSLKDKKHDTIDVKNDLERYSANAQFPLIEMKRWLQENHEELSHSKGLSKAIAKFMGWTIASKELRKKSVEKLVQQLEQWDGQLNSRILKVLHHGSVILSKISNEALLAINSDPRFGQQMRNYQDMLQRKQQLAIEQEKVALQAARVRIEHQKLGLEREKLCEQREYHSAKLGYVPGEFGHALDEWDPDY